MYSLEVLVKKADNLPNVEITGKSDPYCIINYQGITAETKVIDDNLNPEWNETLTIDLKGKPITAADKLEVIVKDYDKFTPDKFMGSNEIPLRNLLTGSGEMPVKLYLKNKKGVDTTGTIEFMLKYRSPPKGGSETGGGGGMTVEQGGDDDSGGGDGGGDAGVYTGGAGGEGGKIGVKGGKMANRKVRSEYSTKPQDFQVRVKVVKATQLQGSNIPPVCKINCAGQNKSTKVKSPTNSPFWNETFFFNFHEAPATLLDKSITFGVYHSKALRQDALIGSFKFDLALAYEQDKHGLINKWLLLCDPEDPLSGPKGYLKMSIVILGPGDDAPSMKANADQDDEDIEGNLLRPAGVQLRPAMFKLRIYKAEDLPRMDPDTFSGVKNLLGSNDDKQYVDPFIEVSFAGKKMKTSTKHSNDHPEWNEEIIINFQFPSMCEKLKFTVFDWDRLSANDAIATGEINLSQISAYAEGSAGFLPTFGPCYINLYGSPREFSDLPDKYEAMNLGKGEGVAYRGRVLVELCTELLDEPTVDEVRPIEPDDVARVQKCLRRRKYILQTAFLSAAKLPGEKDTPVVFEVSVGNYGNLLDESVAPCASTTPPTNPVYDGIAYSYLPWGDDKPCAVVESQWEDISFRLCATNMLHRIADKISRFLSTIQQAILANVDEDEQARLAIDIIDQIILDTSQPLPTWEPDNSPRNAMDNFLRQLREAQLKDLHDKAAESRERLESIPEAIDLMTQFRDIIMQLAIEPQMSFPEIIIWMICGGKRQAYYRIPAYEVLHHTNPMYRGPTCAMPQTLNFKEPKLDSEKEDKFLRTAVQVRALLWLGLEKDQGTWSELLHESKPHIVAETYENQASIVGKWVTTKPPLTRPAWSDSEGKAELQKEKFSLFPGWKWQGDWFVDPELSVLYKKDTGQTVYFEELYYNESRTAASSWTATDPAYTDALGQPRATPENIKLEENWSWDGDWVTDLNRLCDEDGFEYAITSGDGSYEAIDKLYHMFRRKRLVRKRTLGQAGLSVKQTVVGGVIEQKRGKLSTSPDDQWEYAFNFDSKFHTEEKKLDMVRRRRWHREIVVDGKPTSYLIQVNNESSKKAAKKDNLTVPRIYMKYERSHTWQLRAYIFQARNLLAADQSGMSDPYLFCSFQGLCQRTETLQQTICPTWDQTLIFDNIEIYGSPEQIIACPPPVNIEIFDWDKIGSDNYLGRCQIAPFIQTETDSDYTSILEWYSVKKGSRDGGEILASFELLLLDGRDAPFPPPKRGDLYSVPDSIRPKLVRTGIEIVAWGVRNMAKYHLASVNSPSVRFEIGGKIVESAIIKNVKHHPNFPDPVLFMDVMLPEFDKYMPPMNIIVHDHRAFGQKPRVGMHNLSSLRAYKVLPKRSMANPMLMFPGLESSVGKLTDDTSASPPVDKQQKPTKATKKHMDMTQLDDDIDWWSKLYASLGESSRCLKYNEMEYDKLVVYPGHLEDVEEFANFSDFCNTFELQRGKNDEDEDDNYAGQFKGTFRVYYLPDDPAEPLPSKYFEHLMQTAETVEKEKTNVDECIVRVYVIRAMDLQPSDPSGLADPFIEIKIGGKTQSSKDKYIPNTLNPEFGQVFEMKCLLPVDKDLRIRVTDYDMVGTNDVIGETYIDLENRRLTKFRATCGIPQSYYVSGPCQWRDSQLPTEILTEMCKTFDVPPPEYEEPTDAHPYPTCRFLNHKFSLEPFERGRKISPHHGAAKQRLALHILNTLPLVKEHVETRPLFSDLQPGIEQGRIQMWVDMFPLQYGIPGLPVDIAPRVPQEYVLRIVVWNTKDVILQETSLLGEKMSDIYIKGWISGVDERQKTDVHYRSLNGEGNFNWRLVFPFNYLPAENMVVVKRKEHFWSLDATETRVKPNLIMQVWDNDLFNADDFLGTLELSLANMPAPAKKAADCTLAMVQSVGKDIKLMNIFDCKRSKGWWPFMNEDAGNRQLTGKIEMELEIVTKDEETLRPAGPSRDEPNLNPKLDPPNRPETSFLWITSPWKTFKFIVWRRCKWVFIGTLLAIVLGALIVFFVYAFPELLARKVVGV